MSVLADSVMATPAHSTEGVAIVGQSPAHDPGASVRGLGDTQPPERPTRSMTEDELVWLLELEDPNPPGPIPPDPAGDQWREQQESDHAGQLSEADTRDAEPSTAGSVIVAARTATPTTSMAPRPSEVTRPNMVANTARMSITWPGQPQTRSPSSG